MALKARQTRRKQRSGGGEQTNSSERGLGVGASRGPIWEEGSTQGESGKTSKAAGGDAQSGRRPQQGGSVCWDGRRPLQQQTPAGWGWELSPAEG